jgi:hypothetical protein
MAKPTYQPVKPDFEGSIRLHMLLDFIMARELPGSHPASGEALFEWLRTAPASCRTDDPDALRLALAPLIDAGIIEEETNGNFWFAPLDSMRFRLSQCMLHLIGKYGAQLSRKPLVPSPAARPSRYPATKGKR